MKKTFDFSPKYLEKLSLEVKKLVEKREKNKYNIFNKIKVYFKS